MTQPVLFLEGLEGARYLERVQVFAQEVFREGKFKRLLIGEFADDSGDLFQASKPSRSPAALADHELVAPVRPPHHDGLHDSACPDRIGKLPQSFFRKGAPRLVRVGVDEAEEDLLEAGSRRLDFPQEGAKPPPQGPSCHVA